LLYDRRHTFEISEYGGLATPMPKLAAFFLFVALSSLGLPMLNGFAGEFLVLLGTYQRHWQWASWAALGVILSACYLLWSYQRVFFGGLTREENRTLPDASARAKWILVTMAVVTYCVLPWLVWCGSGVIASLVHPFARGRHFLTFLARFGTPAGTAAAVTAAMDAGPGFGGLVQSDSFSFFFRLLVGTVAFLVVLVAEPYLERERLPFAEFYALLLFATAGMGVLASAQELLTAFIGLEMRSISSYILAGYRRDSLKSTESAMKYFLLGSFATAFFLYGIALVYGSSGTTKLTGMG